MPGSNTLRQLVKRYQSVALAVCLLVLSSCSTLPPYQVTHLDDDTMIVVFNSQVMDVNVVTQNVAEEAQKRGKFIVPVNARPVGFRHIKMEFLMTDRVQARVLLGMPPERSYMPKAAPHSTPSRATSNDDNSAFERAAAAAAGAKF